MEVNKYILYMYGIYCMQKRFFFFFISIITTNITHIHTHVILEQISYVLFFSLIS